MSDGRLEAWKGLIDFSKTVLSLSAIVLTAYVSYLIGAGESIEKLQFLPPVVLLVSITCSMFGFGQSLSALKSGNSSKVAIFLSNAGFVALVIAICTIPFVHRPDSESANAVLTQIGTSAKKFSQDLSPARSKSMERKGDTWVVQYVNGSVTTEVIYSIPMQRIESIK